MKTFSPLSQLGKQFICRCSAEEDVKCVGIGAVRSDDMKYWQSRGAVIKLVGYSARSGETVTSCVIPVCSICTSVQQSMLNKEEKEERVMSSV